MSHLDQIVDQLVEQKIKEYESRLKDINGLVEKLETKDVENKYATELDEIKAQCSELQDSKKYIDDISTHNWQEKTIEAAGPMALLDSVAQRIEKIIEKID